MWNPQDGDAPQNFYSALYDSEEEVEEEVESHEHEYEVVDEEESHEHEHEVVDEEADSDGERGDSPTPPLYSPLTSPTRSPVHVAETSPVAANASASSAASSLLRSPPVPEPQTICLRGIYDEDGQQLWEPQIVVEEYDVVMDAEFFVPDSHDLYENVESQNENFERVEEMNESTSANSRGRSLRGRVRRVRGGRARTRGQSIRGRGGARRRQASSWEPGQPLEEVWLSDDDVPAELREMVRDVVRRRQERIVEMEARRQTQRRMRAREDEGDDSESENEDEFHDAVGGRGNALLEGVDLHFDWSPMESFHCVEEAFTPERTGAVSLYESPYDAFRSFWDDSILQTVVDETNRYASQINSTSFQAEWYATNAHEILCLFAFWMMTGIIRMPTIKSYLSNNCLLKTEVFSRIFSYRRYINLNRALHFVDTTQDNSANPTTDDVASFDRMHRLAPIIDHLNRKFQSNYILSKDICIDESLTLWKGRLQFKQYIRSQAAQFGIKTFELCEYNKTITTY